MGFQKKKIDVSAEIRNWAPRMKRIQYRLNELVQYYIVNFPLPDLYIFPKRPYLDTSVADCRRKNILEGNVPLRSEAIL
jgi:hypothetical protein